MTSLLLDETRTERVDLHLPWLRQVRVGPGLFTVLNEHKPAHLSWADFAVLGMIAVVLIDCIMRFDLRGVIRLGVRLTGHSADDLASPLPSVSGADARQSPPSKSPMPARKVG